MALTQATRLLLEGKDFGKVFQENLPSWTKMAETARKVMAQQIAQGEPTIDDVKKILQPMIEIDPKLRKFLADNKLTQKYWISDAADYILDHVYKPKLTIPK